MAAPLMEGIANLQDDSGYCLITKAQLKKNQNNLPGLGLTEGWGFLRTKYRGGLKTKKKKQQQKSPIIYRFKKPKS